MADEPAFEGGFKLYRYDPSLAANIVFIVLFAAVSIGHAVFLFHRRTWSFIPFLLGCMCTPFPASYSDSAEGRRWPLEANQGNIVETIGYIGRAIAAQENPDYSLGAYILQTLLILLGPALLAASIYMILGRLIRLLGAEEYALIRTKWMTKIFVTGDVLSFMAQGAGKYTTGAKHWHNRTPGY